MSDNKQSQQRGGYTQTSISQKNCSSKIDVYGCVLEGKRHQSLAKPDKLKYFSNDPKQTELAKQKHGVNTMHTKTCVTFEMSFATPQSTPLLYFF